MPSPVRNLLPFLIGAAWVYVTWRIVGAPPWSELGALRRGLGPSETVVTAGLIVWFLAMLAAMFVADRIWCRLADRRLGDPAKLHWSRRRNVNGNLICGACRSTFLLPPADLSDDAPVYCGDCGQPFAPYGEMKPFLKDHAAYLMRRWRWRLRF